MTTVSTINQYGTSAYNNIKFFFNEDRMEKAFRVAKTVCAVALGAIAALTSFWLFLPFFVVGAVIGTYNAQQKSHHHSHGHNDGCAQGFIEETTGVHMPRSLALLAGFAVTAVHIDHHATVFVPIVGVTLGIWVGNTAGPALADGMKKFAKFIA